MLGGGRLALSTTSKISKRCAGKWSNGFRFLSTPGNDDNDVNYYLEHTLGINPELHKGILKAIESIHGKDIQVHHLEAFGKPGMEALAASVQALQKKRGGNQKRPSIPIMVKIPHHSTEFTLDWKLGDSLLDLAKTNEDLLGEYMEGTCDGQMSCCTCHVYIDQPEFQEFLPKPRKSELDMLDLAYEPEDYSRLGCQVKLTPEMVNSNVKLEVTIPGGVNNVWS